jgi:hypothetical protein
MTKRDIQSNPWKSAPAARYIALGTNFQNRGLAGVASCCWAWAGTFQRMYQQIIISNYIYWVYLTTAAVCSHEADLCQHRAVVLLHLFTGINVE